MEHLYVARKMLAPDWDVLPTATLMHMPWGTRCFITAKAQACYNEDMLWVRLEAQESPIRATLKAELSTVCTDSCLEFFFAPLFMDPRYFNFGFNPLGTMLLEFGAEKSTRIRQVPRDYKDLFAPQPFSTEKGWGIKFQIPRSFVQLYFPGYTFSGKGRCNFYKCGDHTEVPHYLAWAPLKSSVPDFHRINDFGTIIFK